MPNTKKSFREIAKLCDVSVSTVSRLANGRISASGEKSDLILSYLKEEGYEIKSATAAKTTKNITLIVNDLSNEIFNRIAISLSEQLTQSGYTLSIWIAHNDIQNLLERCAAKHDAGVFLMGTSYSSIRIDTPIPVVHIMGSSETNYHNHVYRVLSDDYVGGQLAARRLLNQGCKHPLILNLRLALTDVFPRIDGFVDEFAKAGIVIPKSDIHTADPVKSSYSDALDTVSYLWTKGASYDSIFAASDWRAYGAISALHSLGAKDVAVIGYDGSRISRYGTYPFPSIQQNPEQIASKSAEILLSLIDDDTLEQHTYFIPVQMSH